MADETQAVQAEKPEMPKKGSKKLLIIIVGVVILALAGGFAGYTFFFKSKDKKEDTAEKKETTVLLQLDPFVVNMTDQGRYLKVAIQLELADITHEALVKGKTAHIRDTIITLLSSKSVESVSGPEGKFQLKDELLLRTNQAIGKDIVKNLYFTDFVMQ